MIAIYAPTLLILLASLLVGRVILALVDWPRPAYLAGAVGFAALVTIAPFILRLPGRATTAAVLLLIGLAAAAFALIRLGVWQPEGRAAAGQREGRAGMSPRSRTPGP
ncbi:MAG: hypothetical protein ACRDKX_06300, partial [Solirubrobacterales bacterium]